MEWKLMIPWIIVREAANEYDLEPNLIAAIISCESSGNTYAIKYEKDFNLRNHPERYAKINNISEETENLLQACSFGLMQVMGCVCRDLDYIGPLTQLFEPELGIEYGCKKLEQLSTKYTSLTDIIAAYNRGSVSKNSKNEYRNQKYVNKVIERLKSI